jgi:hypothetical protein
MKASLAASLITGECLHALAQVFEPIIQSHLSGIVNIASIGQFQWLMIGFPLAMPVAFAWHTWRVRFWGATALEKAEEYIAVLKLGVREANLPKAQQNLYWNAALSRLARDFSVGSMPPGPEAVVQEASVHGDLERG